MKPKLSADQVRYIRLVSQLRSQLPSHRQLARLFNVGKTAVDEAAKGITYKCVREPGQLP